MTKFTEYVDAGLKSLYGIDTSIPFTNEEIEMLSSAIHHEHNEHFGIDSSLPYSWDEVSTVVDKYYGSINW